MDEHAMFDRIHEALDVEPRPGAYDQLRIELTRRPVKPEHVAVLGRMWPRSGVRFAAVFALIVVLLAAMAGFLGLHGLGTHSSPAGIDSVSAYEAMVWDDDSRLLSVQNPLQCTSLQDATCPAGIASVRDALQKWIDDTIRSQPPARFATIHAQIRIHLAADLSDVNAELAAYRAGDDLALYRAWLLASGERNWLDDAAVGVFFSQVGTVATYSQSLRVSSEKLGGCTYCVVLRGQSEVACTEDEQLACESEVVKASLGLGQFEADLVRLAAPAPLAAKDARLQHDAAQADAELLALRTAALKGDQAGFDAGRQAFQKAITVVDADIADILNST